MFQSENYVWKNHFAYKLKTIMYNEIFCFACFGTLVTNCRDTICLVTGPKYLSIDIFQKFCTYAYSSYIRLQINDVLIFHSKWCMFVPCYLLSPNFRALSSHFPPYIIIVSFLFSFHFVRYLLSIEYLFVAYGNANALLSFTILQFGCLYEQKQQLPLFPFTFFDN